MFPRLPTRATFVAATNRVRDTKNAGPVQTPFWYLDPLISNRDKGAGGRSFKGGIVCASVLSFAHRKGGFEIAFSGEM